MDPVVGHGGETRVNNNQRQLVSPGADASTSGAEEQIVLTQRRVLAKTQQLGNRSCRFQARCPVFRQSPPLFFCNNVPNLYPPASSC